MAIKTIIIIVVAGIVISISILSPTTTYSRMFGLSQTRDPIVFLSTAKQRELLTLCSSSSKQRGAAGRRVREKAGVTTKRRKDHNTHL
jgi:hypothetical protein